MLVASRTNDAAKETGSRKPTGLLDNVTNPNPSGLVFPTFGDTSALTIFDFPGFKQTFKANFSGLAVLYFYIQELF